MTFRLLHRCLFLTLCVTTSSLSCGITTATEFSITPSRVELNGNFAEAQVLVQEVPPDGSASKRSADLTHAATYTCADEAIVRVSSTGQLLATVTARRR